MANVTNIALLTNATTVSTGTAAVYPYPSGATLIGEWYVVTATASGAMTVTVVLETSVDNTNWTIVNTWQIVASNSYQNTISYDSPQGNYMRARITAISGTSTTVSVNSQISIQSAITQTSYIQAQSAIPSILAPNGTVATNGAITLGTVLPTIYANAWVYLPAGAVVGGAAGMYFCKFSSTTVGQVYTNFVDASTTAFTPYIPSTQVAAVGSNAGYTQITTTVNITNTTIPANSMGPNGSIRVTSKYTCNNNANIKTIFQLLSTATIYATQTLIISNVGGAYQGTITNRGVTNSQIGVAGIGVGGATLAVYSSIDTTINQPQFSQMSIAVATDYVVLEAFIVEILPA